MLIHVIIKLELIKGEQRVLHLHRGRRDCRRGRHPWAVVGSELPWDLLLGGTVDGGPEEAMENAWSEVDGSEGQVKMIEPPLIIEILHIQDTKLYTLI